MYATTASPSNSGQFVTTSLRLDQQPNNQGLKQPMVIKIIQKRRKCTWYSLLIIIKTRCEVIQVYTILTWADSMRAKCTYFCTKALRTMARSLCKMSCSSWQRMHIWRSVDATGGLRLAPSATCGHEISSAKTLEQTRLYTSTLVLTRSLII